MRRVETTSTKCGSAQARLWYKFAMRFLLVTLLLMVVLPAYGSIILFSGEVSVLSSAPTSLFPPLESNSTILGFAEQQGVVVPTLNVAISTPGVWICCSGLPGGTIDAGTTVNSYLLYASPSSDLNGTYTDFTGSITFSPGERIVGVIVDYTGLYNTDSLLGAPGTTYPPPSDITAGLEKGDRVIIGSGDESVYVNLHIIAGNIDMIRILTTTTPEPADFVLLGSGLIALVLCRKRLRFRRAGRQA
jgi:hypothetical protein